MLYKLYENYVRKMEVFIIYNSKDFQILKLKFVRKIVELFVELQEKRQKNNIKKILRKSWYYFGADDRNRTDTGV